MESYIEPYSHAKLRMINTAPHMKTCLEPASDQHQCDAVNIEIDVGTTTARPV